MGINEKLMNVQKELKAPKGQYNSFGKYKYRSCEDILEAVKPLLAKNKAILTISDDIVMIGNRIYVKATATFEDAEDTAGRIVNTAWAREEDQKKGMDGAQVTGTASSYARKYCLNGLFLIDDTKDADTDEFYKKTHKEEVPVSEQKIGEDRAKALAKELKNRGIEEKTVCGLYKVNSLVDLKEKQLSNIAAHFDEIIAAQEGNNEE